MLLEHPQSPPRAIAPALHSPIVELRQYTLHPGRRDTLIDLFEREFLDTQAQAGISVLGQFRDLDAADRFVWLRGFEDMERRRVSLERFYGGPAWQAHRDAANATMIDSDDVLLLKPVSPASGFAVDGPLPQSKDGDGVFDTSTVFADHMMFPEGAMWLDGSLYVSAPPSITMNDVFRAAMPYVWFGLLVLLLVFLVPPFATFLPRLLGS